MTDRITAYYEGDGVDSAGRLIEEGRAFEFDELRFHRDFIQWLFLNTEQRRMDIPRHLVAILHQGPLSPFRDLLRLMPCCMAATAAALEDYLFLMRSRRNTMSRSRIAPWAARVPSWWVPKILSKGTMVPP